jgi:ribose/xylose/arabinose/galactoside ABC-type transport system permease subunit
MKNQFIGPGRSVKELLLLYGFAGVMAVVIVALSVSTSSFLTVKNIIGLLHTAAPMLITAAGLVMVVMTGKLDISIGSVSFLTSTIGAILMVRMDVSPFLAIPVIFVSGAVVGLVTGFFVAYLKINPLIASLGMLFAVRGVALRLTGGRVISMPPSIARFGNLAIGGVFYVDIVVALAFLLVMYLVHTRTYYGRHIMAIGNDEETARRLGVKVRSVTLISFVVSGFCAAIGGFFSAAQIGAVTLHMGQGLEFTAIAMIVVGGVSLFGGEGSILPGFFLGVLTLNLIENGLNHLGASPYVYPFVRGGIIFAAMYADTLKSRVRKRRGRVAIENTMSTKPGGQIA